ncbi:uncharacterized protein LOC110711282 [Chenopodium quinoa]|uniref:uncharacterized protein LOC110711282 n=1 Tax=Chenopodium quinoa TaxID=63459 RepID=UPI000B7858EE|nr:uncharacterized protein LOC110711282 [Chenopodium quinoa]
MDDAYVIDDQFYGIDQMLLDEEDNAFPFSEFDSENEEEHSQQQSEDNNDVSNADGQLPRGLKAQMVVRFQVHKSKISRVFDDLSKQMSQGNVIDVRNNKLGKVGRKPMEFTDEFLQSVPLYKRTTERSYASALKISHVTIHNLKKRGRLRTHTSTNRPALTLNHKVARLKWALSHVNLIPVQGEPKFVYMQEAIHIDEKWFWLNPETRKFYLLPKEENPYRCQQSRRFKIKAMFMVVVGKSHYDANKNLLHDVKSSKNRVAGTMETKAVESVTKEVTRTMLLEHVIPAIKGKWHHSLAKNVYIQWDNARPHQIPGDPEFQEACTSDGFNIQMVFQPAQSPDLNVLDLGLFTSIQSIQYQSFPTNLDEMIEKVNDAYDQFDPKVNMNTWITLQQCMVEIMKKNGGNNYPPPHMGKNRLEIQGNLPEQIEVNREIIQQVVEHLNTMFRPVNSGEDEDAQMQVDAD